MTGPRASRTMFERLLAVGVFLAGSVVLTALWAVEPSWSPWIALLALAGSCVAVGRYRQLTVGSVVASVRASTWFGVFVGVVVAVSLVAAVMRLPGVLTSGYEKLTGPSYSQAEADVEPLSEYGSPQAVAAAASAIPPGATYSVVGGDVYDAWAMFRFWLAPRPFTSDYRNAAWVIVNGGPPPRDLPPGRRVALAPGIYAIEVSR